MRRVGRVLVAAHHFRRCPEEVNVVGIVGERIETLSLAGGNIFLVLLGGEHIHFHRIGETAHSIIDVRRHMDDVAGGRHQRFESVGGCFGAFGRV